MLEVELCERFFCTLPRTPDPLACLFSSVVAGFGLALLSFSPSADLEEFVLVSFCTPAGAALDARPGLPLTLFFPSPAEGSTPLVAFVTSPRAARLRWAAFPSALAVDFLV
jgi:hypothetical protein